MQELHQITKIKIGKKYPYKTLCHVLDNMNQQSQVSKQTISQVQERSEKMQLGQIHRAEMLYLYGIL